VNCKAVDTRGDPADAVPATRQMFASTPNLAAVIGVTSDEAASVVPLINHNKMVVFAMTGQSEFDHHHYQYFYRLVPPYLEEAYALVAIAHYHKNYKTVALAFGNDIGSQAFVKPVLSAVKKAGMKVVANETLNLSATTFRTEASKIIASHPDVILTEALGPTDATFLSEVKQLNGGHMIPVIGTSATISPQWYKAVSSAVGASTLSQNFLADNLVVLTSGPAYAVFKDNLLASKSKINNTGDINTYLTAPGGVHLYDGVNLAALAMIEAKSTNPAKYQSFIVPLANGVSGAVVVHSFKDAVAALKAGKKIRYEGPGGPINFDSYHTSNGIFQIDTYSPTGQVKIVGNIPNAHLRALS
ncbi:MAG: ABC transporter substrate-binding protein, partial [Acidimicrobiales bacterium]